MSDTITLRISDGDGHVTREVDRARYEATRGDGDLIDLLGVRDFPGSGWVTVTEPDGFTIDLWR